MWCWAASGQMVMDYLGNNVAQCIQANNQFGRADCPCDQCGDTPLPNPPCVEGGFPEFDRYGFTFQRTSGTALTWKELTDELSRNRRCGGTPIAFTWQYKDHLGRDDGGHIMVATGYFEVDGVQYVTINDPRSLGPCAGDQKSITYSAYVSGNGYTHWDDFHHIRD